MSPCRNLCVPCTCTARLNSSPSGYCSFAPTPPPPAHCTGHSTFPPVFVGLRVAALTRSWKVSPCATSKCVLDCAGRRRDLPLLGPYDSGVLGSSCSVLPIISHSSRPAYSVLSH
ncbi:hypothetical protein C8Q79DRAFT_736730 [Trametes meyenii]|nr:hypothetical protein C8Q79DRAFT_736730 [Trametes meyenii]